MVCGPALDVFEEVEITCSHSLGAKTDYHSRRMHGLLFHGPTNFMQDIILATR